MNSNHTKNLFLGSLLAMLITLPILAQKQPTLGIRSVGTLRIAGLQFKDLNKNKKLDAYEDWRLPVDARVKDLVSQMNLEEKVGFMLISTTRMGGDQVFGAGVQPGGPQKPITEGFNEDDLVQSTNMFTRKPLSSPNLSAAGTTKAITKLQLRHFILRANPSPDILAKWSNNLQALCETSRLGIPAIVASNPRNHVTTDASVGLSVGVTAFSKWPGELGLAAMRDFTLTRKFAEIAGVGRL